MPFVAPPREETPVENPRRAPYQPALFPRESGRVVPIHGRTPARRTRTRAQDGPERPPAAYQETFDWSETRQRRGGQEAVRYCNAPVAAPAHRGAAAILDYSVVAIAAGLLFALLHFGVGADLLSQKALPWLAGVMTGCALTYKLLWALAGTDSPGLRWAQLRTLNFDGIEPTRNERLVRVAAGCLSVMAAGVGVVWPLVDEETLSWHDHISKTFATPRGMREYSD